MDEKPFQIDRKDLIEGLGKGLRVIESFDDDHPRLTASETALRAGITRTAARRYLLSLAHFGYAGTDGKHFWLRPRVVRLGQSYLAAEQIARVVQPIASRLADKTGETVNYWVLDHREVIALICCPAPGRITFGYEVGVRLPGDQALPGLAILARSRPEFVAGWIAGIDLGDGDEATAQKRTELSAVIHAASERKHEQSHPSSDMTMQEVAMAVVDRQGEARGAFGITAQCSPSSAEAMVGKLVSSLQEAVSALRDGL